MLKVQWLKTLGPINWDSSMSMSFMEGWSKVTLQGLHSNNLNIQTREKKNLESSLSRRHGWFLQLVALKQGPQLESHVKKVTDVMSLRRFLGSQWGYLQ